MSRKRISMIMLVVACVLGVAVVVSTVLLIIQRVGGLESITISPTFADTELDVNMDYAVAVNTDPSGAKIEKFEFFSDSTAASFEYKDDGTAVLHTNGEGAVTVYVQGKNIESNKLTFQIVDKAAAAAAAAAAEAAAAEAEALAAEQAAAEAAAAEAAAQITYVKCIKDNVNIRSNASTDGDILGKAKLGDTFEVINNDGSWTEFKYGDKSGFMRNDMIEEVSDGSDVSVTEPAAEEKKEEKKEEEKKEPTEEEKAAAAAKAAEDEQKKQQEELQKQQEEAAALAAAQAAAVATGPLPASGAWSYQGTVFSAKEVAYFHGLWDYTGDAAEFVTHHTAGELVTLCTNAGLR